MSIFYLDYENGSDAANGTTWALAWKTMTLGATAARIAPGDIIRIAKSPAPVSLGTTGAWTNASKIVTLGAAQTLNIDLCESAWTKNVVGDTTVALTPTATDAKEGSYSMKLTFDAAVQTEIMQAFFATGTLDLSSSQKISFWFKNSGAITAGTLRIALCSDAAGATPVDYFEIPAIPSTVRWLPLTLERIGGGNLGADINSIALYTNGAVTGLASTYIYVDDFIACTTDGLSLQSLISKNSLEQGGAEGWHGIRCIDGVTVLVDNDTNQRANYGMGYSGTTETVTIYKRETIKTDMASASTTLMQQVMDSGTVGNNIEFQGGYNTVDSSQDGETFFDGLNGNGYAIVLTSRSYVTLNYLNVCRCNYAIYLNGSSNNTLDNISNVNNNLYGVYINNGNNNTINNLLNANNNNYGVYLKGYNNTINTISNANSNGSGGVFFITSNNNTVNTILNANNNNAGVYFSTSSNNTINYLSTSDNIAAGVNNNIGVNYINNALIAEETEATGFTAFAASRLFSNNHDQTPGNHWIFTDGGTMNSLATDRVGGTGLMWKLAITSVNRSSIYPLYLSIAKIAVTANNLVTVKVYMKKDHATDVVGKLVCRGSQLAGVASNVTATKANDTDWEELTITFTPTEAGVIEIEAWAEYSTGNSNIYCEDMSIQQN